MKLTCLRRLYSIMTLFFTTAAFGALTASCDRGIYEDEGDCSVHYRVSFSYDKNMVNANAFHTQVKSVTLYIFDSKGAFVASKTESGASLESPDYYMEVDVKPGKYDLLVWAEGESPVAGHTAFAIGGSAPASISDLTATLPLQGEASALYSDKDIKPLFHGLERRVEFPDTYGNVDVCTVGLTKDTNVLQILLQGTDGTEMDVADFSFRITAENSELSYTNDLVASSPLFDYKPWSVTETEASFDTPDTQAKNSRAQTAANGLLAEITTGRLIADREQKLVVTRNSDGQDIIALPLIKYLLMVKGEYMRPMTNQDYLDRKDAYTMMFFIAPDKSWYIAGGIYINGWRVVPPQDQDL